MNSKTQALLWRWGIRVGMLLVFAFALYAGPAGKIASLLIWDAQVNGSSDRISSSEFDEETERRMQLAADGHAIYTRPIFSTVYYDYVEADSRWAEILDFHDIRMIKQPVLIDLAEYPDAEMEALLKHRPRSVMLLMPPKEEATAEQPLAQGD